MEIQLTGNKTDVVKSLIFSMLDVLGEVGVPVNGTPRRLEKMARSCLAVGDIKTNFAEAKSASDIVSSPQEKSSLTKMQTMVKTFLQVRMMIFVEKICFFLCKPELC